MSDNNSEPSELATSDRGLSDYLDSEGFGYWVNTDDIVAEVRKQRWGPLPRREDLARLLDPAAWRMGVKNAIAASLVQADVVLEAAGLINRDGQ